MKPTPRSLEIKRYVIHHFGGGQRLKFPYEYRAIITVYGDSDSPFAEFRFHVDKDTMPDSDTLSETGKLVIHYPAQEYPNVVDILRNEKPLYLHQYPHRPTMGHFATIQEPVGEGELDL